MCLASQYQLVGLGDSVTMFFLEIFDNILIDDGTLVEFESQFSLTIGGVDALPTWTRGAHKVGLIFPFLEFHVFVGGPFVGTEGKEGHFLPTAQHYK